MDDYIQELLYSIRGAALNVYNELGPGLLESVYEKALIYELKLQGLNVKSQIEVPIIYKGVQISNDMRLDIIVNDTVIIELKSVDMLQKVHYKQLRTYLQLANKPAGILINFNDDNIMHSMHTLYL